jgi:hypothetical protein
MAKQDVNPPRWRIDMADGCSGVADWLPFVGDMSDCCNEHDRKFYYGGGEADFKLANKDFFDCIHAKRRCWLCHQVSKLVAHWRRFGVRRFGRSYFNWKGPGLPK